ncbi:MAG: hypothetical protein E7361_00060 [Clostridiales bacterium]|nr:hypothetical protein [Clostridiales bacterium]
MLHLLLENSAFYDDTTLYGKLISLLRDLAGNLSESTMIWIAVGILALVTVAIMLAKHKTYEKKLMKSVKGLNKYLHTNPYVNDENLVSLNAKFKQSPKALRHGWQEYVLNRDKSPSEYMSTESVIDHPNKASGYKTAIRIAKCLYIISAIVISLLMFLRSIGIDQSEINEKIFTVRTIFDIVFLPGLLLLLGYLIIVIFESTYSSFINDLYYEYREFQGYINKACTTMPPYIDYEILFTPKEIKDGISVLQEYLDKKAIMDQKEKEEEALNKQNYEKFDFDELGVEGSILLERAMTESEKYFNIKRNLVERRTSKEQEIANYSKNFDDVTKDFERKAQTIRESMNQITEQLNNTSVKIEANYLKKRYDEEQQKLQQLEKDHQLSEARFKKQQAELQEELDAIDEEVESRRKKLETIMTAEGKTYSNKIYGIINDIVNKQNEPHMKEMEEQKVAMEEEIENMKSKINSCELELNTKSEKINELERELGQKLAEIETIDSIKEYFTSPEFRQRVQASSMSPEEYREMVSAQELQTKLARAEEELAQEKAKNSKLEARAKMPENVTVAKPVTATKPVVKEVQKKETQKVNNLDFDKESKKMINEANAEAKAQSSTKSKTVSSLNSKKNSLMNSIQKLNSIKKK